MPTIQRPSYCFFLFTILALACQPSGSATPNSADVPLSASEPAAPAEPVTYNLRGTPIKGQTRHIEMNLDIVDAKLTIKVGAIVVPGTMSMRIQGIDDLEILAVSGGMVRQGRLTHVVDKVTTTTRVAIPGSEAETEEELGELHGRTELIELNDGQWTRRLVGAAPSAELAAELEAPPNEDAIYPTAIKIGESWTVPASYLRQYTGSEFTLTKGHLTSTLRAVEVVSAETIATIDSVGEVGGKGRKEDGMEVDLTMTFQVTERRSLERAMEVETTGKGTIQLSGTSLEEGHSTSLSVTGPFTMQIKGALY